LWITKGNSVSPSDGWRSYYKYLILFINLYIQQQAKGPVSKEFKGCDKSMTIPISDLVTLVPMELFVWQYKKQQDHAIPEHGHAFLFETCMRKIYVDGSLPRSISVQPTALGEEAYGLLLRVICGLDSPLLGETEVMGQFREQIKNAPSRLLPILDQLLTDAKDVRRRHLIGIGAVSYGSIVRSLWKRSPSVLLWGAGNLGRELRPWMDSISERVEWCSRSARKEWNTQSWDLFSAAGKYDLVIAGSGNDEELGLSLAKHKRIHWARVIDFRDNKTFSGECETYTSFADIQKVAQDNSKRIQEIGDRAQEHVQLKARQWSNRLQVRPHGWEDLALAFR
jgi:glutamyl-tRNA reductase